LVQNINDVDRLRPGDQVLASWLVEHGFALPAEGASAAPEEEAVTEAKEASRVD
jgi:hypothetical protein